MIRADAAAGNAPDGREQALLAFTPALEFASSRQALLRLADRPPQVLLLEGGAEYTRAAVARWWAALLNCAARGPQGPCLACPVCLQIGAGEHLDCIALDGRISNKEDEENPGVVRALTMKRIQILRKQLGEAPHGAGRRVVILAGLEAQARTEAANALLKTLEEPLAHSVFVLLAPQREQMLPTLVSRSWVLTLPWPAGAEFSPVAGEWESALARFLEDGVGWFDHTSARGLEPARVQELLLACQKALAAVLSGRTDRALARCFASRLDADGIQAAGELLGRMQDALRYAVNPALAADALATEFYALVRRAEKSPPDSGLPGGL
jgi:DNA polymerase-3 subunit delta'